MSTLSQENLHSLAIPNARIAEVRWIFDVWRCLDHAAFNLAG